MSPLRSFGAELVSESEAWGNGVFERSDNVTEAAGAGVMGALLVKGVTSHALACGLGFSWLDSGGLVYEMEAYLTHELGWLSNSIVQIRH